jgi:hypothetical protein
MGNTNAVLSHLSKYYEHAMSWFLVFAARAKMVRGRCEERM